jgi:hypothetical protein
MGFVVIIIALFVIAVVGGHLATLSNKRGHAKITRMARATGAARSKYDSECMERQAKLNAQALADELERRGKRPDGSGGV